MSAEADRLPGLLARARATWRAVEGLRALAAWLGPVAGALLALLALDNLLHLPGWLRLGLGLGWLGGAAALFAWRVLARLGRRPSWAATARLLEERLGVGGNVLINALQLAREARDPRRAVPEAALSEVRSRAARAAGHLDLKRLWRLAPLARAVRVAVVALALLVLYAVLLPEHAANAVRRYGDPLGQLPPVTDVWLEVEPGDAVVLAGATLDVRARVTVRRGEPPATATLLVRAPGEPWQGRAMSEASAGPARRDFAAALGPAWSALEYRVESGAASSPTWRVGVRRPPAVVGSSLLLEPPA